MMRRAWGRLSELGVRCGSMVVVSGEMTMKYRQKKNIFATFAVY